ncbi:threonine synthase [Fructobacillus americanaquae]|uniref:Threonine synthase n=1 Tax=Fructobacillus americanaquae TaxID=2940302 RepID=A0ABY5C392_9LACO|nr:threonine synthase [Fructobacillus americanaquae]USS92073.1 threonine synthase [Fructobacillus americanaquae]
MEYVSTRGEAPAVSAAQAILRGLAPDGGLYVPNQWPTLHLDLKTIGQQSYQDLAVEIFAAFLPDFTKAEIQAVVQAAYGSQWDTDKIVPIKDAGNNLYYLELFHGPTLAFKDIALQALPHLVMTAAKKEGLNKEIAILTATSGDTGTAAMAGFADVPGTKIAVLYPQVGVSDIQRQQMVSEPGKNTYVYGIEGNFDDAQQAVKGLLGDSNFATFLKEEDIQISSANSINIGRLVPQIVYYFYGYGQLVESGQIKPGEEIDVLVPTGNFGNMLAAYYASQIGLPVADFTVASNENHVLTELFQTGVYNKNRDFKVTNAPAMDILVSSNLERLLYFAGGQDADLIKKDMADLQSQGSYHLAEKTRAGLMKFSAGWTDQDQVEETIRKTFVASGYLIDPHTAVAVHQYQDDGHPTLLAATASPYKFPQTVLAALGEEVIGGEGGLTALAAATKTTIPDQVKNLFQRPIRHQTFIQAADIQRQIESALKTD